MQPAARSANPIIGTFLLVVTLGFALSAVAGCGSDGNITVGVISTPPLPDLPTLTPVPVASATPTTMASPTVTPRPTNTPEPSNCCSEHAEAGCDDPVCEACVCGVDPDDFCCGTGAASGWDANCIDIALVECIDACTCE